MKWTILGQILNFQKIDLGQLLSLKVKFFINSIYPFSLILRPEKSILRHEKVSLVALFTTTIIFYIPFLSIF